MMLVAEAKVTFARSGAHRGRSQEVHVRRIRATPESSAARLRRPSVSRFRRFGRKTQSTEKGVKAFLLKMPVVGENFGQPFPPHRLHRNAIRQAVALVGTGSIELPGRQETTPGSAGPREQRNSSRMRSTLPHALRRNCSGAVAEKSEVFGQHFVGCNDVRSLPTRLSEPMPADGRYR